MINIREIIRRFLKYLILVLIMAFSVQNIPSQKLSNLQETLYIVVIAGMTFCILDIVTPSIQITVNKEEQDQ